MNNKRILALVTVVISFLVTEIKAMDNKERLINVLRQHDTSTYIQKETLIHTQHDISSNHGLSRRLKKINIDDDNMDLEEGDDGDDNDNDDNDDIEDMDDDFGESTDTFKNSSGDPTCVPISVCELCHGGKRGGHDGCSATGKRVKSKCILPEGDGGGYKIAIEYRPCNRTSMDEEYIMIQFQAICLFVAFISLRAVRREKVVSASLFELRTRRKLRQEMAPLNPKDSDADLVGKGIDNAV